MNKFFIKKYIKILILLVIIFCIFNFSKLVLAQTSPIQTSRAGITAAQLNAIITAAPGTEARQDQSIWERMAAWAEEKGLDELWKQKEELAGASFKSALGYFLNTLAYDTATYLATGDEGQKPMFYTDGWGKYLANKADNAAGTFLEELGKSGSLGAKFNLCEPDLAVKLKINLGLLKSRRPREPKCTFSEMKNNWEQELKDPNFLNKVQDMFNPWSNDLGIALTLQSGIETEVSNEVNKAIREREQSDGFRDVTDSISDYIKTPASIVAKQAGLVLEDASTKEKTYTGTLADAIDVFINTLAGKLMQKWLREGLVSDFPDNSYDWSRLSEYDYSSTGSGIAGAKERFRSLIEPEFGVRGDYNILGELVTCPDPTKAGPTNCVITENFRQAIANHLTVGEAIQEGYLNPEGVFGFTSDGLEPAYYEGYSYRSMIILRKFRIIPVGWEVAAQYIKDNVDTNNDIAGTTFNLRNLIDCYSSDPNDGHDGYFDLWCEGLVDPDWVLKAPLNYCRREGPGPEIQSSQVIGQGSDSKLAISRNNNYCADEQTCIKEKDDGSCDLYGYCTEERRKWNFNGQSCDPKYNTCETFRSADGQTVSYLENTLDYIGCTSDNVGCAGYCRDYNYNSDSYTCALTTGNKIYLDEGVDECSADSEGCHEFIRTKAGVGGNMIINSSFENTLAAVWAASGNQALDAYDGQYGLRLDPAATPVNITYTVGAPGHSVGGEVFTFSLYAKNCSGDISLETDTTNFSAGDTWQLYKASHTYPLGAALGNQVNLSIQFSGNNCIIDAIKLERGGTATTYSDYRGDGLTYLKLAPAYLGCGGTSNPPECDNFVRGCTASELGCNLYTSVSDNVTVPAKVSAQDYCPAECAGYDTFIQEGTNFDSTRADYFIPESAKSCGAAAVGCDMFTNLDAVEQGGEDIEYFTYLRQCLKPGPGANCANYYTWEGSNETGYQLRVHSLIDDGSGQPSVTNAAYSCNTPGVCDDNIYGLPISDPAYNPDCREFYNRNGQVFYCLYSKTYSCSDDCLPYRRTLVNHDPLIVRNNCGIGISCMASGADGQDKCWDGTVGECVDCLNDGRWSVQHQACIYDAIPSESMRCGAGSAGCREYTGNSGNNMRIVFSSDFEGSIQDWQGYGGGATTAELSSDALMVGGNSLRAYSGSPVEIGIILDDQIRQGSAYVVQFIAKSETGPVSLNVSLTNGTDISNFTGSAALTTSWNVYKLNLGNLNHTVTPTETLFISGDGNFYIDDIRLTEISGRYYLIKNSWQTPAVCDYDLNGNPAPQYMLGCDQYRDIKNDTHYLYQFTELCQESSIGCEVMIDTHNYTSEQAGAWSSISVPADEFKYIVYNSKKQCNRVDKGCERLGDPYYYEQHVFYSDVFLKNNPDEYSTTLCSAQGDGCEAYSNDEGTSYFKDPGGQACEYRQSSGDPNAGPGWYKIAVKRCDNNIINNTIDPLVEIDICLKDSDCGAGIACIDDNNDYLCQVSTLKTFGIGGGAGNRVSQPFIDINNNIWAGLCPAGEAGCSEYVDPVSRFSNNIIFNNNFTQDVDNDSIPDGWSSSATQRVDIKPYTLYRLAGTNLPTHTLSLDCGGGGDLRILDPLINLLSGNNDPRTNPRVDLNLGGVTRSLLFYSGINTSCTVELSSSPGVQPTGSSIEVELKQAIIDYQIEEKLDTGSCNGIVNFEEGCVLFNKRSYEGINYNYAGLIWDADLTIDDGNGLSPVSFGGGEDSNIIIKATPDRSCAKWLACRSYIKDENDNNVCFNIGLCDSVDDKGDCDNFIISGQTNQTYTGSGDADKYANFSGYAKVGHAVSANLIEPNDYYPLGAMQQDGESAVIPNSGFEMAASDGYPPGWVWLRTSTSTWNRSIFSVIDNPIDTQEECLNTGCTPYVPEGRGFLKLGSTFNATSEFIDIFGDSTYYISAYINTLNLKDGQASIDVLQYNDAGLPLATPNDIISGVINMDSGLGWMPQLGSFHTSPGTVRIRLRLTSNSINVKGNFYYDNIKIRSALRVKDLTPANQSDFNFWHTPASCRLYPENDSLSCSYFEDSGIFKKGWLGYCLEHDRYPGSSDACLLWWPVDKVKGEGIEEGAGYSDKVPVYYCLEATALTPLEYRHTQSQTSTLCDGDFFDGWPCYMPGCNGSWTWGAGCTGCTPGYYPCVISNGSCDTSYLSPTTQPSQAPLANQYLDNCIYDCNVNDCRSSSGWFPYNGFHLDEANYGVKFYNPNTGEVADDEFAYCSRVVQTVNSVGHNKYWSGRVYEGSSYQTPFLGITYDIDDPPFGSINPPSLYTPIDWDGSSLNGYQPLPISLDTSKARAAVPYSINNVPLGLIGFCSINKRLCLTITGASSTNNLADCAPGEGTCVAAAFPSTPQESIKRLFAQSYGAWAWNPATFRYEEFNGYDWTVPDSLCSPNPFSRSVYPNDYCYILPRVDNDYNNSNGNNIKVNDLTGNIVINPNQFVNLTFNSLLDAQQLPLVMYAVDWGDKEGTIVSGVEMRDRPNPNNPHSLYHLYSYWDLKAKAAQGVYGTNHFIDCQTVCDAPSPNTGVNYGAGSGACCAIQPGVKVKDNWGYCNNGTVDPATNISINPCPVPSPPDGSDYIKFNGWIVVTEN